MTADLPVPVLEVEKHSQPLQRRSYRSFGSPPSSSASSTSSLFSTDALSQSSRSSACSITSSIYSATETHETDKSWLLSRRSQTFPPPSGILSPKLGHLTLPPIGTEGRATPAALEHRQHPRRSSTAAKQWQPPTLVRQSERKGNFVDKLVDSATSIVEIIWPLSVPSCQNDNSAGRGVLPLRTFIQETLRRSRTSYSTLQAALYYLILIKPHVPGHDFTMEQPNDAQASRALQCGRRMFLAALILASKYLQDRNYSARAWSKISGLRVCEINNNELTFCRTVEWNFHIPERIFDRWSEIVLRHTPPSQPPPPSGGVPNRKVDDWKVTIPLLTPGLGTLAVSSSNEKFARSKVFAETKDWVATSLPGDGASLDTTPTPAKPPRYLEPKFEMAPPPPSLARLGLLPTPQLTPKTLVGANPLISRPQFTAQGAIKLTASTVTGRTQSVGPNRPQMDEWMQLARPTSLEGCQLSNSKVSFAPPSVASSGSSPESMISDQLSRSSRASSISSVSSSNLGYQPNLARVAVRRSANIPMAAHPEYELTKMAENISTVSGSNIYTDDTVTALEHLVFSDGPSAVNTPSPPMRRDLSVPAQAANGLSQRSPDMGPRRSNARPRKRGRPSNDMTNLQREVRTILHATSPTLRPTSSSQLPAAQTLLSLGKEASGCTTPTGKELSQRPEIVRKLSMPQRLPVQKDLGRKRACCANELFNESGMKGVAISHTRWQGPGICGVDL